MGQCSWWRIKPALRRAHPPTPAGLTSNAIPPRDSGWDTACVRTAITVGLHAGRFCAAPGSDPGAPAAQPQITQALVLRALRRVELPESQLKVQPPGGETLVNFKTNFYTEQEPFTRTVQLLGRTVDLKIWPSQFHWRFGDGADLASSSAGAPYPDLEITHAYESKGSVSPERGHDLRGAVPGGRWGVARRGRHGHDRGQPGAAAGPDRPAGAGLLPVEVRGGSEPPRRWDAPRSRGAERRHHPRCASGSPIATSRVARHQHLLRDRSNKCSSRCLPRSNTCSNLDHTFDRTPDRGAWRRPVQTSPPRTVGGGH